MPPSIYGGWYEETKQRKIVTVMVRIRKPDSNKMRNMMKFQLKFFGGVFGGIYKKHGLHRVYFKKQRLFYIGTK